MHKAATTASDRRRRETLRYKTPTALRRGRRSRTMDKGRIFFNLPSKCGLSPEASDKSRLYSTKKAVNVKAEIATVKGMGDKGWEKPRSKYNSFTVKPINIRKARLRATEKSIVSRKLSSFSLKSLRMANPGMNDMKIKTMISLKIGMLNKIAIFAKKVIIGMSIKTFLMFSVTQCQFVFDFKRFFE